jgi:hypothetical protein
MRRDIERRLGAVEGRHGRVALILDRIKTLTDEELAANAPVCDPTTLTDEELKQLIEALDHWR